MHLKQITRVLFASFFLAALPLSAKTLPLLSDAKEMLSSDPKQSLKMFEEILPTISQQVQSAQIQWYTLGIQAANATLDNDRGYALTKLLFEEYWQVATDRDKRFITSQFGRYASIKGDFENAELLFNCTLLLNPNESDQLSAMNNLAIVNIQTGQWSKAKDIYEKGIDMAKAQQNQRVLAAMSNNLGHIWFQLKDVKKAQQAFKDAYIVKTRLGEQNSRLVSLHNLMQSIAYLNDWQQWQLYHPLYQRMLQQIDLPELNAQHQWMLAYRQWNTQRQLPTLEVKNALYQATENIQNPSAKTYINDLAKRMTFKPVFNEKVDATQKPGNKRIAFFEKVVAKCEVQRNN